jgi:3,4-dihydroxy 2-butanone 4-phosphate synthase / GTP cyclohydrolase II
VNVCAYVYPETLGALDCDCVQQLNGALEVIASKPCGVLFYLIQEGRGCGYVGKSRDRQLVQVGACAMQPCGGPLT